MRSDRHRLQVVPAALALALALGCVTVESPGMAEPDPVEQAAKQAAARYNVGIDHLNNGRNALAVRDLRASLDLAPDDPWTHFGLAEAYRRVGRTDDAVGHLQRALELKPDFQSARLNLSGVLIQQGHYREAADQAEILLEDPTFPTPWRALTNLGWCQFRLGDRATARENLELAGEYHARYWPALLNLGILEEAEGRKLEALTLLLKVIDLNPGPLASAEAHYRSAEIFISLGQQDKAMGHLVAVAESEPNGKWGEKSEQYLDLLR